MSGNKKIGPEDVNVVIKFGGGLHTRASPEAIDPTEAADGFNFLIDLDNKNLRNRPPFDLIGTVPNAAEVRGGVSFVMADGTVKAAFQAGNKVYAWDGETTFTEIGTVSATAKLRGRWDSHAWPLGDKVLITDLNLAETVKEWDGGATISSVSFTNEAGSGFGNFFAKYCSVSDERALFLNTKDPGSTNPHMMVGSSRSDYRIITITDRPSTSISDDDPFFMLTPDLKPINGHVNAFKTNIVSTEKGKLFNLAGQGASDFNFEEFYPGSGAAGSESVVYIGNDIIYGRPGRIESLTDTNRVGDSQADDITVKVANVIKAYPGWMSAFNSRLSRLYMFPTDISECWVFDPSIKQAADTSAWMRWTTDHAIGFKPTFVLPMLDPADGLEYVFMGDASGNIYRLEGNGANGDGGTNAIHLSYLTKLYSGRLDAKINSVEGYIKYAKNAAASVQLTFRYQGIEIFDKAVTIDLPEISGASYFGGDAFFGGDFYYGSLAGRLARKIYEPPGDANDFQVQIDVIGNSDISINEIGLRFRQAS